PYFSWATGNLFGLTNCTIYEQQFGMVWVMNENPQPGSSDSPNRIDQERINRNVSDHAIFPVAFPEFARPASNHPSTVNAAFCDGHVKILRDDMDYLVYQRLLTANGPKCVDPDDWDHLTKPGETIYNFRRAPPLAEGDY